MEGELLPEAAYLGGAVSGYLTFCSDFQLGVAGNDEVDRVHAAYAGPPSSEEYNCPPVAYPTRTKKTTKFPPPPPVTGRNWNEEFQTLIARYRKAAGRKRQDPEKMIAVLAELASFTTDFLEQAKAVSSHIVSELTVKEKRIPPLGDVGAGGEKFAYDGMFFKLARDGPGHVSLYGGDEFAMKTASHEVKGMVGCITALLNAGLCFPMMATINVRGWRFTVLPYLPISKHTLVYGSCDRGCTVYNTDQNMDRMMDSVGRQLNLKKHLCGLGGVQAEIVGPTDIEGHVVTSSQGKRRYYILDTARLFPPEDPSFRKAKGGVLYKLLRPELLIRNEQPLSSDVFLPFGRHGRPREEAFVVAATARLYSQVIPEFARFLVASRVVDDALERYPYDWYEYVRLAMHRHGINLRYLGSVRSLVPIAEAPEVRKVLLTEMVVRTLRTMLDNALRPTKKKMKTTKKRTKKSENDMGAKAITRYYCAYVVDKSSEEEEQEERSRAFWSSGGKDGIKRVLVRKYPEALSAEEEAERFDLRDVIDVGELTRRLPPHARLQPQGRHHCSPFYLDVSLLEEGRAHLLRYLRYKPQPESEQAEAKAANLLPALEKLHRAYLVHPKNDYRVLANLGNVYYLIASEWSNVKHMPGYAGIKRRVGERGGAGRRGTVREMLCRKGMGYLREAIDIAYRGRQPTRIDDGDDPVVVDPAEGSDDGEQDLDSSVFFKNLRSRRLSMRLWPGDRSKQSWPAEEEMESVCLSMDEGESETSEGEDGAEKKRKEKQEEKRKKAQKQKKKKKEKEVKKKAKETKREREEHRTWEGFEALTKNEGQGKWRLRLSIGPGCQIDHGHHAEQRPGREDPHIKGPRGSFTYAGRSDGSAETYESAPPPTTDVRSGAEGPTSSSSGGKNKGSENVAGVDKDIHEAWDALCDCNLLLAQRAASSAERQGHVKEAKFCLRAALQLLESGEASATTDTILGEAWTGEMERYRAKHASILAVKWCR